MLHLSSGDMGGNGHVSDLFFDQDWRSDVPGRFFMLASAWRKISLMSCSLYSVVMSRVSGKLVSVRMISIEISMEQFQLTSEGGCKFHGILTGDVGMQGKINGD